MGALGAYLAIVLLLTVGQALASAFGARALMVNKGRSAAGGFCLGLFLGLIGVLIAAVMPTTPEYEAAKMRRQMELMGLAPGGAPFAPSGFAQPAAVAPRREVPRPLVPMAILVAAAGVAYAVVAKWDRNAVVGYEASSGTVWLAMLLSLGVCAAAIWAMRQQNEMYVSLVVGLMMGLGSAGVANLVWAINLTSPSRAVVMVADVVVLVAAGLVVFDRGRPVEVPTWWMWAWAGTTAVIVLSVALSFRVVLSIGAIAGVIAVFGAVRHSQRSLSVAVGWGAGLCVRILLWGGPGSEWDDTSGPTLLALAGAALAVVGFMVLRQAPAGQEARAAVAPSVGAPFAPPSPPQATPPISPLLQAPPPPPPPPGGGWGSV